MKSKAYKKFILLSKEVLANGIEELEISNISTDEIFTDYKTFKAHTHFQKIKKLNNLADHLNSFENQAKKRDIKVLWATNYEDVSEEIKKIKKTYEIRNAWYKTDYILEEIGIQYFFKENNIRLSTTDESDVLIYQANGIIEDLGSIYFEFDDRASLESISLNKPKIIVCGIDSIFCNMQEVESYRSVRSFHKKQEKSPLYSLVYNPYKEPVKSPVFVIIVDNGRSELLEEPEIRKTLACIHCGACSKVCPVSKSVGKEPYDNIFWGPVSNVILPYLEDKEEYKYLSYACTLCGKCEQVCPMSIPLTRLILKNRNQLSEHKQGKLYSYLSNRKKMNSASWIKNSVISMNLSSDFKKSRKLRSIQDKTFNQLWLEQNKDKQDV